MIGAGVLASVYGGATAIKNASYDHGLVKSKQLRWPVVSVGNITVGGSGKTPFVMALIEAFRRHYVECDVLTRGYGRRSSGIHVVDPKGTADEYGDEPLLIARRTGATVIVGADRHAAGVLAESLVTSDEQRIHLLDDGFQHRRLARDFDIVLLGRDHAHGSLLPAGRLREPASSLTRADAIATAESFRLPDNVPNVQHWRYTRHVDVPLDLARPVAFCGIAHPERFFDDVKRARVHTAYSFAYRDHHRFSQTDIDQLLAWRDENKGDGFLTTEKDLVRLGALAHQLEPLLTVRLYIELFDPDRLIAGMLSAIAGRRKHS
jgi:tetraacyldisaccharide 4'-kinase